MVFKVADFFSGCGGTSAGLKRAGMEIVLGLDFDADAASTFKCNLSPKCFIQQDISKVKLKDLSPWLSRREGEVLVFCGCAPCQPFTKINVAKSNEDSRRTLLKQFGRFVRGFRPDYVVVENVPGLQAVHATSGPLGDFLGLLTRMNYQYKTGIVECQFYGVPQCRRRLVIIATKHGVAPWPKKTNGPDSENKKLPTVWDFIGDLPPIKAGERHDTIPNHGAMRLSEKNLRRIACTPEGKGRECWPDELNLDCHAGHKGHTDVYGRLRKDRPAAAMTTKCISLSNGRFGHPTQNRALSVREAARLQTFDEDFIFSGGLTSAAKQIGNAVPVSLAEQIGKSILNHWKERSDK
jgi:DNA (cytosine-5)-methyltransferase 1